MGRAPRARAEHTPRSLASEFFRRPRQGIPRPSPSRGNRTIGELFRRPGAGRRRAGGRGRPGARRRCRSHSGTCGRAGRVGRSQVAPPQAGAVWALVAGRCTWARIYAAQTGSEKSDRRVRFALGLGSMRLRRAPPAGGEGARGALGLGSMRLRRGSEGAARAPQHPGSGTWARIYAPQTGLGGPPDGRRIAASGRAALGARIS
jgi:hypothetical protein